MRIEKSARPSRLLRVREFQDKVVKKPAVAPARAKQGKSRFVAPYYFSDKDRSAIETLLADAGLGDGEGRQLFITAVEYEVGSLRPALQAEPEPERRVAPPGPRVHSKAEIELAQLGQAAEQLQAMLGKTHKTGRTTLGKRLEASDPFGREHGERYFQQLTLELGRIADAGRLPPDAPSAAPEEPEVPAVSETAKRLIAQLARIFGECLEVRLDASQTEVLARILCVIRDSADARVPCEAAQIAELLTQIEK